MSQTYPHLLHYLDIINMIFIWIISNATPYLLQYVYQVYQSLCNYIIMVDIISPIYTADTIYPHIRYLSPSSGLMYAIYSPFCPGKYKQWGWFICRVALHNYYANWHIRSVAYPLTSWFRYNGSSFLPTKLHGRIYTSLLSDYAHNAQ